jgi:predicted patatin/cPLA2 family phospholipase
MTTNLPLKLERLPNSLPLDGAINIELVDSIPIFRASGKVKKRIEILVTKQKDSLITDEEEQELDEYEELDDYLSLVNRLIRNASLNQ